VRPLAHRLEAFEDLDRIGAVVLAAVRDGGELVLGGLQGCLAFSLDFEGA